MVRSGTEFGLQLATTVKTAIANGDKRQKNKNKREHEGTRRRAKPLRLTTSRIISIPIVALRMCLVSGDVYY